MIIFIDGLDNVGKTTQIKRIINHFNLDVFISIHHTAVKQKSAEDSIRQTGAYTRRVFSLARSLNGIGESLIADRCHLSEMVYSKLYRGYDGDYVLGIEREYLTLLREIVLITLIDTPENVVSRDDGLSFSTKLEDKRKEIDAFVSATNWSKISNKRVINIAGKDEDAVFEEILGFLKEVESGE